MCDRFAGVPAFQPGRTSDRSAAALTAQTCPKQRQVGRNDLDVGVRPSTRTSCTPSIPATTSRPILDSRLTKVSDKWMVLKDPHPVMVALQETRSKTYNKGYQRDNSRGGERVTYNKVAHSICIASVDQ